MTVFQRSTVAFDWCTSTFVFVGNLTLCLCNILPALASNFFSVPHFSGGSLYALLCLLCYVVLKKIEVDRKLVLNRSLTCV